MMEFTDLLDEYLELKADYNEHKLRMKYGNKNEIPPCEVSCPADIFENAIREIGVEFACEWFGHNADSDFTKETIRVLCERSGIQTLNRGE